MTAAMNILLHVENLEMILREMDLPEMRTTASISNIAWLLRNLQIKNKDHPRFEEASAILKRIITERQ